MPFPYKKVLVIGATSGIGEALASRFVQEGSSVIVVGRRKDRLETFVHKHGKEKASAVPFDITETEKIPNFVTKASITKTHEDLDCVVLNSGVQRGWDLSKPESLDLGVIEMEFKTNYLSYIALTKGFLPFLQGKQEESALIYTSSGLALVPMERCFNYCATKAALHAFILVLREQLKGSKIKVVEIFPPAVQTELHDSDKQPDFKDSGSFGMPLDDFTNEAYEGLVARKEDVPVGMAKGGYDAFEPKRQELFVKMASRMRGGK